MGFLTTFDFKFQVHSVPGIRRQRFDVTPFFLWNANIKIRKNVVVFYAIRLIVAFLRENVTFHRKRSTLQND